jgi:hypothetical protein
MEALRLQSLIMVPLAFARLSARPNATYAQVSQSYAVKKKAIGDPTRPLLVEKLIPSRIFYRLRHEHFRRSLRSSNISRNAGKRGPQHRRGRCVLSL